ncbi:MAG: HDIG domain-containing protein [Candidatus Omnitrophica bacterium]|nr:HDIG domain-containing protein [Candidatus Omnitrophota bacterium]MDD5352524.1 HDIG domain-containing protein [Candidatus Omnitrophota bacterium]MDD5550122.1 HDIG domain-containing protein [Candidatus Omnitrophota bacterium]
MKDQTKKIIRKIILYTLAFVFLVSFSWISQINLILTLLLFFIFAYLEIIESRRTKKTDILQLSFLFTLGFAIAVFFKRYTNLSVYFVPIPAIAMLTVILFSNLEIALLMSFCLSIFTGFIFHASLYVAVVMFLGSLSGVFFAYRIRQRSKIIQAGLAVSVAMVLSLIFIYRIPIAVLPVFYRHLIPAFINGIVSAFIVAGALPIFESLFNLVTNISLLELSDFNHPLLKRLVLEAPGTYHHSLLVGNLAEMAAEAINANALLARVGAYYHDIGKLEKPEYFSENQPEPLSRHEQLKASMSKIVITNHVKDGIGLAKKYKLNSAITQFIEQHHGTSLVFYFYLRALEQTQEQSEIKEDGFRYAGPKPQTKETAIVLLADSVEAACRAVEVPNVQRIEEVVQTVINNKFIDGQLDDCDLTLKDLTKISKIFIHILSAVYHSRVEYPEKKSENNNKESSREDHNKPSQYKKNS